MNCFYYMHTYVYQGTRHEVYARQGKSYQIGDSLYHQCMSVLTRRRGDVLVSVSLKAPPLPAFTCNALPFLYLYVFSSSVPRPPNLSLPPLHKKHCILSGDVSPSRLHSVLLSPLSSLSPRQSFALSFMTSIEPGPSPSPPSLRTTPLGNPSGTGFHPVFRCLV